jgi:hypothetical protein
VAREDGFGLIFVNFHWNRSGRGIRNRDRRWYWAVPEPVKRHATATA